MQTRKILIAVGAAMIATTLSASAWAGLIQVPGDYPTIQAAIDASSDGDEVVLADGTYTGPGNQDLDLGGREITIRSDNGAAACTIDVDAGFTSTPAINITAIDGPDTRIEGITFTGDFGARGILWNGGTATVEDCVFDGLSTSGLFDGGGAVFQTGGDSTFIGCAFRNNFGGECSGGGGAISVGNGALTVTDCDFESNRALGGPCAGTGSARGGAISGSLTLIDITGSRFDENVADGFSASLGGAISLTDCTGTIAGCSFDANDCPAGSPDGSSGKGGALYIEDGIVAVRDCAFTANIARGGNAFWEFGADSGTARGGAIHAEGANVGVTRSDFDANRASASTQGLFGGGALSVAAGGAMVAVNCTFTGDAATGPVGGVGGALLAESDAGLANCLVTQADAVTGSAVYADAPVELTSSTIDDNVDANAGPVHTTASGSTTVRNAIVRTTQASAFDGPGATNVAYSNVTGVAAGVGNIDAAPGYVDAGNGNYRLAAGSPSIDTGNAADLPPDVTDVDDDGNVVEPLPIDLGGGMRVLGKDVDMGAYETSCAGDLDGDGSVGFSDLTQLLADWGRCPGCPEDLDGNDSVGFSDLTILLADWGVCP